MKPISKNSWRASAMVEALFSAVLLMFLLVSVSVVFSRLFGRLSQEENLRDQMMEIKTRRTKAVYKRFRRAHRFVLPKNDSDVGGTISDTIEFGDS